MDDIFGELDPLRRNALMSHLPCNAQKWITTTHLDWLADTPGLAALGRYRLADGAVRPERGGCCVLPIVRCAWLRFR
jgi:DNA replication and repair protein RecF